MKKVIMTFADGFEMVEALSVVDILRRGDVTVDMCSITNNLYLKSVHNVEIKMDKLLSEIDIRDYDGIILPGGMPGTTHLRESALVCDFISKMNEQCKLIGAICAAPTVLGACDLLKEKKAACHPAFEDKLLSKELILNKMVVVDGNIITSRGMATSLEFGFAILGILTDDETTKKIKTSVVYMY